MIAAAGFLRGGAGRPPGRSTRGGSVSVVPRLTVVMPMKDERDFVRESLGALQGQTFGRFDLIVIDDSSTDGSRQIVEELARTDARIRIVSVDPEIGSTETLNRLVGSGGTELIARMDADDVCSPDRLERQLEVIDSNPDAVLVGTLCEGIDSSGSIVRPVEKRRLLATTYSPFPHGSVIFSKTAFVRVGGY